MTKGDKVLVILFRYLLGIGSLFALVLVFMPMSSSTAFPISVVTQEIIGMTRLQLGKAYKFAWTPATPEQGGPT